MTVYRQTWTQRKKKVTCSKTNCTVGEMGRTEKDASVIDVAEMTVYRQPLKQRISYMSHGVLVRKSVTYVHAYSEFLHATYKAWCDLFP